MLKIIAIVIIVLIAAILIFAATKPDDLHVKRTVWIKAPPEKIFPLINDFHAWGLWTPYNKDPAMKKTYGGAASGVGATYAWDGNKEVGKGSISITESVPNTRIAFNLDMLKPFEGHNKVVINLQASDGGTQVTWALHDKTPYMGKVMSVFMNMDKLIGTDFEVGLANLKTICEK